MNCTHEKRTRSHLHKTDVYIYDEIGDIEKMEIGLDFEYCNECGMMFKILDK